VETESEEAPVLGGALSLLQARELANTVSRQRKLGRDVVEEQKVAKRRQKIAAVEKAANTFGPATQEFFKEHKTKYGSNGYVGWLTRSG
jgi:hypothetical protein